MGSVCSLANRQRQDQMNHALDPDVAAVLFEGARTHSGWLSREVPDGLLATLYQRLRWAPTSMNSNPGRFLFVRSADAKKRLVAHLMPNNVEKTMSAPVCVIVAKDARFHDFMPQLLPGRPLREHFEQKPAARRGNFNAQRDTPGGLPDTGGAIARPRLRPDVRLQRRFPRCGLLPRWSLEVGFPGQHRLWRCRKTPAS